MTGSSGLADRTGPNWKRRTVWELLEEVARGHPDKEALVAVDDSGVETRVSYTELLHRSATLSAGLTGIGVRRGDRLALWMTNLVEWVYTFLAVTRLGATLIPMNTWWKDAEVAFALRQGRARHLVVLDRFRRVAFCDSLSTICAEWPISIPGALFSSSFPELRSVIVLNRDGLNRSGYSFDFANLAATTDPDSLARCAAIASTVEPEDAAFILFTSGSTGFPKGVVLQQFGFVTNPLIHTQHLGLDDGDRMFMSVPFFHVGGTIWCLMTMLSRGGTLVFTEAWDAARAARLMEREHITFTMQVTSMYRDLGIELEREPRDLSSLRLCNWNVAVADELISKIRVQQVFDMYGMTETYGPATLTAPTAPQIWSGPLNGEPLEGIEIRIAEPKTGKPLPAETTGEILVRGLVMKEYDGLPTETSKAIESDGWLHTEDLGYLTAGGQLVFSGRLKAMIKVGGENVAAEEVETCIRSFPGVLECCVIAVADPRYDEACRAYVVLDSEKTAQTLLPKLRDWCADRLASFKVPREFLVIQSLPMTGSLRVDRAAVVKFDRSNSPV